MSMCGFRPCTASRIKLRVRVLVMIRVEVRFRIMVSVARQNILYPRISEPQSRDPQTPQTGTTAETIQTVQTCRRDATLDITNIY